MTENNNILHDVEIGRELPETKRFLRPNGHYVLAYFALILVPCCCINEMLDPVDMNLQPRASEHGLFL